MGQESLKERWRRGEGATRRTPCMSEHSGMDTVTRLFVVHTKLHSTGHSERAQGATDVHNSSMEISSHTVSNKIPGGPKFGHHLELSLDCMVQTPSELPLVCRLAVDCKPEWRHKAPKGNHKLHYVTGAARNVQTNGRSGQASP